jgi:hypothetical protein
MFHVMNVAKTLCAFLVAAALVPGTALAHFGHHHGVVLKGTVTSVNASDHTLVVSVAKASRGGAALVGDSVTVKAVKGAVADTNNDGKHSIADVKDGDTVLVFTKRRFVNTAANTVSAAFVVDKSSFGDSGQASGDGSRGDFRDGDHHCDGH